MTPGALLASAVALHAASGLIGMFRARLAAALVALGSVSGLAAALPVLLGAPSVRIRRPWAIPGGELDLLLDPLAALFLVPVLVVSALGALYAIAYWRDEEQPSAPLVRLFYGLTSAGLVLVMAAHNGVLFLAAWEIVGLSAFFLVGAEGGPEPRSAAWVYLVATHTATLALFVLFGILRLESGSFALDPLPEGVAAGPLGTALFALALVGFGIKAGLMPLHVWLPGAHAAAPSHVSALMSGVIIKMGVYGLVRILSLLAGAPASWGLTLFLLGVASGVLGVAYALGQHDLKRLLAYHSVENVGIIAMGFGLGFLGRAAGSPELMVLGFAGGALHVWNHAFFKALLFYGAGAVVHMAGTRDMERLGGLLRRAPATALLFLLGAVAICGLPPLNGFVSELFIYGGLLRAVLGSDGTAVTGAAPASRLVLVGALGALGLCSIGALALACFVKAFGVVFLGEPRDGRAGHEVAWAMRVPGMVLGGLCIAIGLFPGLAARPLAPVVASLSAAAAPASLAGGGGGRAIALEDLVPFAPWTRINLLLVLLLALGAATAATVRQRRGARQAGTWDCGYARPTARMQYTGSSLAAGLVHAFRWALLPSRHEPGTLALLPREARFSSHVPEVVLERAIRPAVHGAARLFSILAYLQMGRVQMYLLYVLVTLVVMLWWV